MRVHSSSKRTLDSGADREGAAMVGAGESSMGDVARQDA
jgi:hypothetical protein